MSRVLLELGLALIPKLIKSKQARKDAKETAKKALSDLPSNTMALAAASASAGTYTGTIPLPHSLLPYSDIISAVLMLAAAIWAKSFPEEKEVNK